MSFGESLLIALFLLMIVFIVLLGLFGCIHLFSFATEKLLALKNSKPSPQTTNVSDTAVCTPSNELKLTEVDEPTAAMIMAIVSDESGIPLDELQFKSVKRLDNDEQK